MRVDIIQKRGKYYQINTFVGAKSNSTLVSWKIIFCLIDPIKNITSSFGCHVIKSPSPFLIKKGFASIFRSYSNIELHSIFDSFIELTGFPAKEIFPSAYSKEEFYDEIEFYCKQSCCVMGTKRNLKSKQHDENGRIKIQLVPLHAYTIISTKIIEHGGRTIRTIVIFDLLRHIVINKENLTHIEEIDKFNENEHKNGFVMMQYDDIFEDIHVIVGSCCTNITGKYNTIIEHHFPCYKELIMTEIETSEEFYLIFHFNVIETSEERTEEISDEQSDERSEEESDFNFKIIISSNDGYETEEIFNMKDRNYYCLHIPSLFISHLKFKINILKMKEEDDKIEYESLTYEDYSLSLNLLIRSFGKINVKP